MTEHLDLDALADALAKHGSGAGAGPEAAGEGGQDAAAHLSRCPACSDRLAELATAEASVAASLALLPTPPMPAELIGRIQRALAAEPSPVGQAEPSRSPAPASTPTPTPTPAPASTVTPLDERRRTKARPSWPMSVAAGVVLLCGAGVGYALLSDREDSLSETAALDSAGGSAAGLPANESGLDYKDQAAVAGALADVLAGTAGPAERMAAGAQDNTSLPALPPSAGAPLATTLDPLDRLREPAGLASCLVALLPPEEPDLRPLALDYARYGGAPALAVLLPDPDPAKVAVFIVGPDCSQTDDDTLFFTRLDKP